MSSAFLRCRRALPSYGMRIARTVPTEQRKIMKTRILNPQPHGFSNRQICLGNTLLTIFSNSCVGFFCCGTAKQKLYRSREGWMNVLAFGGSLGGMAISHWGLACQLRSPKQEDEQTTEATIATSARRAAVNRQTRLDWNTGVI